MKNKLKEVKDKIYLEVNGLIVAIFQNVNVVIDNFGDFEVYALYDRQKNLITSFISYTTEYIPFELGVKNENE